MVQLPPLNIQETDFSTQKFEDNNTQKNTSILLDYGMLVCNGNIFGTTKNLKLYIDSSFKKIKTVESIITEKFKDIKLGNLYDQICFEHHLSFSHRKA